MTAATVVQAENTPQVRAAFIEMGYSYVRTSNVAMGVLTMLVVAALRDAVPASALYGWAGAHVVNQSARRYLAFRHARAKEGHGCDPKWWGALIASTLASALIHAVFCLVVLDLGDLHVTTIVVLVAFVMTGGGLTFIALSLVQLYGYCALMFVPLAFVALSAIPVHGELALWLGLLTLWMAYCCVRYGRSLFRLNLNQIRQKLLLDEQAHAIAAAQRRAEDAKRAKTRFVAAASHDLRQPLQALGTYSTLLEDAHDRHETHALAAKMHTLLESLEHSLDSLSDICRLEAGTLVARIEAIPLQEVIDRAVLAISQAAQGRKLKLRVQRTRLWVRTDPVLLERIVVNLLSNAVRYTLQGRIVVGVRRLPSGLVRLDVHDTGIGIPSDQIDVAFAPYRRLHQGPRGLGLGLTIVREFAELLGHRLSVRSQPGLGSRFSVSLAGATAQVRAATVPTTDLPAPTFAGASVVIIDDDPAVRDSLRAIFERWGCRVSAFPDAERALSRLDIWEIGPDVIVADYDLGEGATGVQAIDAIRARWGRAIPAIVITGQQGRVGRCTAPGVVLIKPVAPSALRASVGALLANWPAAELS